MGVPEGEETEQGIENLFEKIMMENFHYLVKEIDIQVQEVSNKINSKKPTPRCIVIRTLKSAREKATYKAASVRLSADFTVETAA